MSVPILLRNLKQSATVFAALKTRTVTPPTSCSSMPSSNAGPREVDQAQGRVLDLRAPGLAIDRHPDFERALRGQAVEAESGKKTHDAPGHPECSLGEMLPFRELRTGASVQAPPNTLNDLLFAKTLDLGTGNPRPLEVARAGDADTVQQAQRSIRGGHVCYNSSAITDNYREIVTAPTSGRQRCEERPRPPCRSWRRPRCRTPPSRRTGGALQLRKEALVAGGGHVANIAEERDRGKGRPGACSQLHATRRAACPELRREQLGESLGGVWMSGSRLVIATVP